MKDHPLHTPGPWTVEDPMDGELSIVEAGKPTHEWKFIATIYLKQIGDDTDDEWPLHVSEANARLIAAAPDLLAALKELGDWVAAGLQASDEAWPDAKCLKHTEEIAARARAAVDKAEGRPCDRCGGSSRLTIYDTPVYFGQPCSPIGDEPCPKCSPDGDAT